MATETVLVPIVGGDAGKAMLLLGGGLLHLEADRSFSQTILGDTDDGDGTCDMGDTCTMNYANNNDEAFKPAPTGGNANLLNHDACLSVDAAVENDRRLLGCNGTEPASKRQTISTVVRLTPSPKTRRSIAAKPKVGHPNALQAIVKQHRAMQSCHPTTTRQQVISTLRIAPSTKRPALVAPSCEDRNLKRQKADTPNNEPSTECSTIGNRREQGRGGRDGGMTRRPHPDSPLRRPLPHGNTMA